jgi:hypothetical protein
MNVLPSSSYGLRPCRRRQDGGPLAGSLRLIKRSVKRVRSMWPGPDHGL